MTDRCTVLSRNAIAPGVIRSECSCGFVAEGAPKDTDASVMEHLGPPCGCPAFDERSGWHTKADHDTDCGTWPEPCGGCWGCHAAQVSYYASKETSR